MKLLKVKILYFLAYLIFNYFALADSVPVVREMEMLERNTNYLFSISPALHSHELLINS